MAKTLVALNDNVNFNNNLFKVSESLFKNIRNELFVGLVIKDFSYKSGLPGYFGETTLKNIFPEAPSGWDETDTEKAKIISLFEEGANSRGLHCKVFNKFEISAYELHKQSVYADLLVLSYKVFLNPLTNKPDNSFIYQILKGCRCPVLILPDETTQIDNIIFTYDGKESSVFAIRAFSSLFSSTMRDKEVTVLTVMPSAEEEIKNEKLLMELIKQHYYNIGVKLLESTNISQEISDFAEKNQNSLLVMGAYGRSKISNLFIPSVAKTILIRSKIPLFIAHR